MKRLVMCFLLCVIVMSFSFPTSIIAEEEKKHIKVGVSLFNRYVHKNGTEKLDGFGIRYWEMVFEEIGIDSYEFVISDFSTKLKNVENGVVDIAIGGITATAEREERMDFSFPTFVSGQYMLVPYKMKTVNVFWIIFNRLGTWTNVFLFLGLSLYINIIGGILWRVEKGNPTIPPVYNFLEKNIEESGYFVSKQIIWESITTIGRGKYYPGTIWGYRITKLSFWIGAIYVSYIIGIISTGIIISTQDTIDSNIKFPEDMKGKIVITKYDTESVRVAKKYRAAKIIQLKLDEEEEKQGVDIVDKMAEAVLSGRADVILYDYPALVDYEKNKGKGRVIGVCKKFDTCFYAYAMQSGSWLKERINRAILKLHDPKYDNLHKQEFGDMSY